MDIEHSFVWLLMNAAIGKYISFYIIYVEFFYRASILVRYSSALGGLSSKYSGCCLEYA